MQKARGHTFSPKRHSATTACRHTVSGSISLLSKGCFSPFLHGTSSLSVVYIYLALEDGPPRFRQGFSCPAVLGACPNASHQRFHQRGYYPLWQHFPEL